MHNVEGLCPNGKFTCNETLYGGEIICIDQDKVCDGRYDCKLNVNYLTSDEQNCKICPHGRFRCSEKLKDRDGKVKAYN